VSPATATATAEIREIEDRVILTSEQIGERRRAMDADVWLFIKWVCKHGAEDIERFHRPLAYLLAGDAVRLAACLNTYDSEVVTQIRRFLRSQSPPVDWNTRTGIRQLAKILEKVNDRIARASGKTTIGRDVVLWTGSVDPNRNIAIVSKSDDAAWAMCEAIGNMMRTDEYRTYYPDRLFPVNPEAQITKKWIRMYGRTVPEQETIEARGVNSQWYSKHYHLIYGDDLSSTEAKQGDATVDDANRFIASLRGISMAERWGGARYVFNGTIQGAKDDHATLSAPDAGYISLVIPIWRHHAGAAWNLSNLLDDGIPVLPELNSLDAIREMRKETLSNPKHGAISWMQNFCMTAHEAGSMEFSTELLRRSYFTWVVKKSISQRTGKEEHRRFIRRYLWTVDAKGQKIPKTNPQLEPSTDECRCWMGCSRGNKHAYVEYDPLTLPRVLAVDQAVSGKGDKWAVAAGCQDPQGYIYALKGRAGRGRGYADLLNAIPMVFNQWGGRSNPPRKVGIESNAAQQTTAVWMQRAEEFSFLARRIVKLSPSGIQKTMRIYNGVLAGLLQMTLLLDPEDHDRDTEMLGYNSASEDPEDDILDAIAMMVTLFGQPTGEDVAGTTESYARDQLAQVTRDCDPATMIDVSFDPMEFTWN